MLILLSFSIILLIIFLIILFVYWSIHYSMMRNKIKESSINYEWSTFFKFYKLFKENENKFIYRPLFKNSLFYDYLKFNEDSKNCNKYYLHADMIIFNNIGLILDPVSIILFKIFMKYKIQLKKIEKENAEFSRTE